MNSIFKRRSIREYIDKNINSSDIELILKAGMNAPSAHNEKPTYYIVIDDKETLKWLSEVNEHGRMLKNADHAIIVCSEEISPYWIPDASAATENMLLEATELGIGSCWLALYPKDIESIIKEHLHIPSNIRAFSIVSLGYPAQLKEENNYFDKNRIFYNEWR